MMRGDIHGDGTSSARTSGGNAGVYWYDPATGKAWPFDGHYGGDDKLLKLRRVEQGSDTAEAILRDMPDPALTAFIVLAKYASDGSEVAAWLKRRSAWLGIETADTVDDTK